MDVHTNQFGIIDKINFDIVAWSSAIDSIGNIFATDLVRDTFAAISPNFPQFPKQFDGFGFSQQIIRVLVYLCYRYLQVQCPILATLSGSNAFHRYAIAANQFVFLFEHFIPMPRSKTHVGCKLLDVSFEGFDFLQMVGIGFMVRWVKSQSTIELTY